MFFGGADLGFEVAEGGDEGGAVWVVLVLAEGGDGVVDEVGGGGGEGGGGDGEGGEGG